MSDYLRTHVWRGAFLAHALEAAARTVVDQADAMLRTHGLDIPSRAVSTLLLIGERREITQSEIARTLDHPHQLAGQRIALLTAAGLVDRPKVGADRRRRLLTLTPRGEIQFARLGRLLAQADRAFADLSTELGADLLVLPSRLEAALEGKSLTDRISATAGTS